MIVLSYEISELVLREDKSVENVEVVELKVGKVLKKLMEEDRHTLASLARATGVPKSTLSEWLSNRSPNPVQAVRVANHLGVSLHFLLFGSDDAAEPITKLLKEEVFSGTFEINIRRVKIGK